MEVAHTKTFQPGFKFCVSINTFTRIQALHGVRSFQSNHVIGSGFLKIQLILILTDLPKPLIKGFPLSISNLEILNIRIPCHDLKIALFLAAQGMRCLVEFFREYRGLRRSK